MDWKLTADLLVIVAYFGAIVGIGVYFSRRSGSMQDFALGGRSIPWWAVLASILAAEISAGTFFGTPGEGYALKNYTYAQLLLGYLMARVVVSAVFIPAYYRHNVVSIYEFLDQRFGVRTRRVASAVFLVTRVLASGARLWVPTVLAVIIWNLNFPDQQLSTWGTFWICAVSLVVVTILTALYTAIGGIKAVIWTDVIQIVVLFCALGFSLWFLLGHIQGGWEGAKQHLTGAHDLKLFQWSGDHPADTLWGKIKSIFETEYTMWAALFGSLFTTMATHGTDQDMVQRMLTAKNKKQSAMATILSGLADIPVVLAVLTIGILLSVYYGPGGIGSSMLPLNPAGKVDNMKVFPYFVMTEMPGGLRGLVIAGVLATTMGSLGTAMNSLATSYVRDFHFRWFGEPKDEAGKVRAVRKATVLFAIFLILVGLGTALVKAHNPNLRIIPIILGSFGYTYGSLLGVFLLALFVPGRGSDRGNIMAMVAGFLGVAYLSGLDGGFASMFGGTGLPRPDWMPTLEFPWWILCGTVITFCVAVCFPSPARTAAEEKEM
ncbi:MAG TPA: sodium:solute symporter [Verrucomicrobiales bacterium]|nr:sodium:solute symporter [Verrucomicrobiales bacterium]